MFEEQITESIEAGAPDITYSGNEGPKSPQQEQQMMMQEQEQMQMAGGENDRVRELLYKQETRGLSEIEKIELRELIKTISAGMQQQDQGMMMAGTDYSSREYKIKLIEGFMRDEGLDLGAATAKAEWIIREKLKPRQGGAYGGIMGLDGRKQYGFGSSLKKRFRKLIPNEVAKVAEVAAPFVAPFNPIAAGLMSGIGGFDRTGSIGSSLKSGLMNYGLGQGARYLGGAGVQTGFNPMTGSGVEGAGFFSKPTGSGGIKNLFNKGTNTSPGIERISGGDYGQFTEPTFGAGDALGGEMMTTGSKIAETAATTKTPKGILQTIKKFGLDNKAILGILGVSTAAGAYTAATEVDEVLGDVKRGTGLPSGILGIRTEVIEAFKDPTGEKLAAIRIKYPFLGAKDTKDMSEMAYGGRIGYRDGTPPKTNFQTWLKNNGHTIQSLMQPEELGLLRAEFLREYGADYAQGGRARRAEGGIMDLDGMELDYRAEGGFVPIGEEEKADDVPARLSVNEFVFTADAVRNAGGGDIDQGAEVMERVMKNLEQGGQISEETQGNTGAQGMFDVSERLGEVI